ncbi:MAG: hypothetical protein R3C53_09415 [Pirellulaceae bacterium]
MLRKIKPATVACVTAVVLTSTAIACNIPVFRYALERWKPDASEIVVFHDDKLSAADGEQLFKLQPTPASHLNATLVRVDVSKNTDPERRDLWTELKRNHAAALPYVLIRTKLGRGRYLNHWHGSLAQTEQLELLQSPARNEIRQRLLAGHSVVWLLIGSADAKRTQALRAMTEGCFDSLQSNVELPEGIGLPGSELYAEVPLVLKFSLLEIKHGDPQEQLLLSLLTGLRLEAFEQGEPLLVPVFGRGRALEVIPASDVSPELIQDLTLYLSGACSCQVKEQNPGFDLMIDADWDSELFGDQENRPPDRSTEEGKNRSQVLQIPPGRKLRTP